MADCGLVTVIAVGAIIGILTVIFTFILGVTRVWFSMSRDGLLPRWFAKLHPVRRVPSRLTWIVGVGSGLIAGFLPIQEAAELTKARAAGLVCTKASSACRSPLGSVPRIIRGDHG